MLHFHVLIGNGKQPVFILLAAKRLIVFASSVSLRAGMLASPQLGHSEELSFFHKMSHVFRSNTQVA